MSTNIEGIPITGESMIARSFEGVDIHPIFNGIPLGSGPIPRGVRISTEEVQEIWRNRDA